MKFNRDTKVTCAYQDICSGCHFIPSPYHEQESRKKNHLLILLKEAGLLAQNEIGFLSAGASHLRDRLDFTLEEGRLGLFHKTRREIVDIEICAQLSPALQEWLTEFRQIQFPFKKGSVRLRAGPGGQKGAWLDFANIDIKTLLDEKTILENLLNKAFVEIGQRRKVPLWNGQEFKLKDPELRPWFQTWVQDQSVNLHCQIASFTQPSLQANKVICDVIGTWIKNFNGARVIEFGSGIGNLTIPAAAASASLLACEIDELSLQGLQRTLDYLPRNLAQIKDKVKIHRGDFQKKLFQDFSQFDGVLANPPRSGLMNFLNPLEQLGPSERPEFFIYMSCFPESMIVDMKRLVACGYEIQELIIVDQFPQTTHYEVLGLLQRK
ncbi:class I SAM-dependent RNA methyltransferase [Bdellovibrio reynosensis]|uniref:RNA methyltransferase n=1 Tax=Bdellovibrio reynosensis TaxID=2835041 RepID=A0ABY4CAU1_9BACT|nr:RNA methyltransferase [Bdellovibrio reynosensis]UOF01968.1 RNA methyltransferase [Bdellovibrio reynosensis]